MPYKNLVITPPSKLLRPSKTQQFYKGYSTVNNAKLTSKLFDYDLVKQNIINTFQTKLGERVMNPNFGTIIWSLIYEPLTDSVKQAIADDVTRILRSDPRAIPTQINIQEADYGMLISASLFFVNEDKSADLSLSFNKDSGIVS